MDHALTFLLQHFLSRNKININASELKLQLLSHPDFPAANAITDLFDHFKIENTALKAPTTLEILQQLPHIFLAHLDSEEIVVAEKKGDNIKVIFSKKENKIYSQNDFLKIWTGIFIVTEKTSTKNNQELFISKLNAGLFILISFFIFSFIYLNSFSFYVLPFFISSFLGVLVSIFILQKEWGINNNLVDKFCNTTAHVDCESTLQSKQSNITKHLKWSDLGIIYFSSWALSILTFTLQQNHFSSLFFWSSASTIPFVFYSIFHQWKIAKKWCLLCSAILVLFLFNFLFSWKNNLFNYAIDINVIYFFLFNSLFITAAWFNLKHYFKNNSTFKNLQIEHLKFKRNYKFFHTSIFNNTPIPTQINGLKKEIIFGNKTKEARLEILLVTNPLCFYCQEIHAIAARILAAQNPDIKIVIRFRVDAQKPDNIDTRIALKLLEIYQYRGEQLCLQAMHEIYSGANRSAWLAQWRTTHDPLAHLSHLAITSQWCEDFRVNFTPAIFINGYPFPEEYELSDLFFFFDDLIGQFSLSQTDKAPMEPSL